MTRTQIQLPDPLFLRARRFAKREEISLAELVRHSLEMFLRCAAPSADADAAKEKWTLPVVRDLRSFGDPFEDPDWRAKLHLGDGTGREELVVAEPARPGNAHRASRKGTQA